jgi:hypothetical protein
MNIAGKLSRQQLQEILVNIYTKGNELADINTLDIVKEIKEIILNEK